MNETVRALSQVELAAVTSRLEAQVLTGVPATAGDPFQAGLTVVVEDSATGLDRLVEGLARIGVGPTYALRHDVIDGRLRWTEGVVIDAGADLGALGYDIGFVINGMDFVLTDADARWAVLTTTDVVLIGGPPETVRAYVGDEAGVARIRAAFADFVDGPDVRPEYQRMRAFQRD